jgi:hypothetical protein
MQERINTQSDNCKIRIEAKEYGVQVLITKGLIDKVVTNKNEGPDSQQKNLAPPFNDNFTTLLFAPARHCVLVHPLWPCT